MPEKVAGAVVLLVLVGIGLLTGLWAAETAVSEQANFTDVNGENVQRSDDWTQLSVDGDRYEVFSVVDNQTDEELERGTDYYTDLDGGRLAFNRSTGNVSVDYRVADVDDQTAAVMGISYPIFRMAAWFTFVAGVAAVLIGLQHLRTRGSRGAY